MSETIKLVVDMVQRRPACALVQAVYGCRGGHTLAQFDPGTWLVAPTKDMHIVEGTPEQWRQFADECNHRTKCGEKES